MIKGFDKNIILSMITYSFFYVLVSVFSIILIDFYTVIFSNIIFFLGLFLLFITNKNKECINIYQIIYTIGYLYICISYWYMIDSNYTYLLAWDIENYFLPKVRSFLEYGSLVQAEKENWKDFNLLSRYQSGYFGYLIPFAYLSQYLGSILYVSMQFSTLLIASLSGPLIYNLLCVNNIDKKKSFNYTLIICLFSVLFFYSTQLLRDVPVMFLYLLGIYFTFNTIFSWINLLKILIVVIFSFTLRVETGIFLMLLIPVYLILTIQASKKRNIAILSSVIVFLLGLTFLAINFSQIFLILNDNSEIYLESDKGTGVIGTLQNIPIIGSILAILYNAIQPFPFWSKYQINGSFDRPEVYNIMTFPLSFASFFNWIVIFFILTFAFHNKIRKKVIPFVSRPLLYQLYLGILFLYIQALVIDQRRLMAYYVVFYIFFYIIWVNISKNDKGRLFMCALSSYVVLQLFALIWVI